MKFKVLSLIAIVTMMAGAFGAAAPAQAAPPPPDYKPVDIGPKIREWEATEARLSGSPVNPDGLDTYSDDAAAEYSCYSGNSRLWLSLDDYNNAYFFTEFHLIAESDGAELWVQADLSWPDGDPRDTPVVTCDQAEYLVSQFDTNIYPEEVDFFGAPDVHDGSASLLETWGYFPSGTFYNEDGRQVILVSNIRDDSYYDYTYPNYIAGFYSPTFEAYFDRNIMSIDAYDWANRVGPDGSRPYLYEGVFAHEYQHLLHDDYDSDEVNWVNEGLSMFAEFLTGYVEGNDAYSTFEALPENSLTAWGDQGGREIVADYGMVFLWHMYMYEKFGQEFIQAEFHNSLNDISSVNDSLTSIGSGETFESVFPKFSVAVLIDSEAEGFEYGFDNLDVGIDIGHPGQRNPDAYDTPGAPPWGTDYYLLWGYESLAGLDFNGVRFNPDWTSDGDVLYSGDGDLLDNWAIFEADSITATSKLTFDTYWDIEDNWDFGFVQVSTDDGASWTSLPGAYTTDVIDPDGHPDIAANLPGLTGWSCYYAADPCWINLEYDLSAYDGQDILIAFRYMTDWAFTYEGWFIDNVMVDGTLISDGSSADDFMSYAEFMDVQNQYTVTLVGERKVRGKTEYAVEEILTGDYMASFDDFKQIFEDYHTIVMLVTFNADEGTTSYADYSYQFLNGGGKVFKNGR